MRKDIRSDAIEDQKIKIHHDHKDWNNKLDFYNSEIKFFQKELEEVIKVHSKSKSVLAKAREFQEILKKEDLILLELQEEIKYQEKIFDVDEIVPENITYHLVLKGRMSDFFQRTEEIKPNLKGFVSQNN